MTQQSLLHKHPHKIWLYINIGVSVLCILVVIWLAYQKNRFSYPVTVETSIPQQETSVITSEFENISAQLPNKIDDIHAFVDVIRQQSKEQLRIRQQKNNDKTFAPEHIIPKYFKEFYGDKTAMNRY